MQFVRFKQKDGLVAHGILEGTQILEVEGSIFTEFSKTGRNYELDGVKLLTPCEPSKIVCVGMNFIEHIKEINREVPKEPAHFMKPPSSLINPGENIVYPRVAQQVDYEGEMGLIIKDTIYDITPEEVPEHVLGVMPFNDVTERIISHTPSIVTRCKGFDTFTSFGPVVDTEIDIEKATIRTYLNGEKVQEDSTANQIFSSAFIVSYLSQCMTFYPGDVISTGTPHHCLAMQDGDKVEIEIEGIDMKLVNYVYDPKHHN
ncbi:MAG: fumarylacetoacetate hydrolase family protein [Spirochaetaceae bacterium]|nr:fumarylacetoacetate hydrolase family protein [Spirochaetaceae bacterium]MCF7947377.1 fumarylacetoacetate hydrolase family protein [Spirochaetia bacterium]MCF7950313.1 fumarylacetoacetate hydrolase family protein [Spirochaetaceae bacterium]